MTILRFRRAVAGMCCVVLLAGTAPAMAQEGDMTAYPRGNADATDMMADILIVRPISVVGSVLGAALFIVTLPFTLTTQSTDEAARELLGKPLEYTFNRPLGDFDHCGAARHGCGSF
ncbi:MAG: hypothetical protein JNM61_09620 [Zoogloeaceae bacterium]|nr:hypothetical protein [Zoogloeaceae bacterium]